MLIAVTHMMYGHNQPGDGFTAGVIISLGVAFWYVVFGYENTKRRLTWLKPTPLIGAGLLLVIASSTAAAFVNGSFFSPVDFGAMLSLPLPAGFSLSSSFLFELAICLAVLGIPQIVQRPTILLALSPTYAIQFWVERPGIAFVAMKRNIGDLPELLQLGKRLGVMHFHVSNLLPHTEQMSGEVLYGAALRSITYSPSPWLRRLILPKMDLDDLTTGPFRAALNSGYNVVLAGTNLGLSNDVCTFIESGSMIVGWDGSVSPCAPLLHLRRMACKW